MNRRQFISQTAQATLAVQILKSNALRADAAPLHQFKSAKPGLHQHRFGVDCIPLKEYSDAATWEWPLRWMRDAA